MSLVGPQADKVRAGAQAARAHDWATIHDLRAALQGTLKLLADFKVSGPAVKEADAMLAKWEVCSCCREAGPEGCGCCNETGLRRAAWDTGKCFECGHELHAPFCPACNPEMVASSQLESSVEAAGLAICTTDCFECGHALEGPWCPACNPPAPWRPERDAIARIIDPHNWSLFENPPDFLWSDLQAGRDRVRADSLGKADAILALAPAEARSQPAEASPAETFAEELARLQREIAERQMRLQRLVLGDPTQGVLVQVGCDAVYLGTLPTPPKAEGDQ